MEVLLSLAMHYVYVLLSLADGKFYIGFTGDLKRRLAEHQAGKNVSTKCRLPLRLVYYEAHLSKADAMRRERYFKTSKGKGTLRQMLRDSLQTMPSI
ncbi:MAG: GIY-YIG nuclease family protein [Phycisphaerales bacterium]|nr:MAG: GIY-YIG nuclease family protein [Phycisphaerales bacterium]